MSTKMKDNKEKSFDDTLYALVPDVFAGFSDSSVSRLHFVIVNQKNNVWLYDLGSSLGVYVDGTKIYGKCFLPGSHIVKFGGCTISVKSDINMLF
jgi:pSer/pThr/pTyr-binding forkhead associated (FHA) protein